MKSICKQLLRDYNLNYKIIKLLVNFSTSADTTGPGCCSLLLSLLSMLVVMITLPISLCLCIKVVQEYERAVIFRLGRLRSGGAKGPGIFFILPCIDSYKKVDLRTVSFDVPPQEVVGDVDHYYSTILHLTGVIQGLSHRGS